MSYNTHTHLSQALVAAAMLIGAAVARPGVIAAQSVTPEQALLNRLPAAEVPLGFHATLYMPVDETAVELTGEQALLGRTSPGAVRIEFEIETLPVLLETRPIDGEAALLGRRHWTAVPR